MSGAQGRFAAIMAELNGIEDLSSAQRDLVASLLATVGDLAHAETDLLDLKIADTALAEMVEAFELFRPYRQVPKLTMFGSARTRPDDPVYVLAKELAAHLASEGWMVVTGAGPGIMQAGAEGAGLAHSLGVNIKLPMEQGANPFIDKDSKLVEMRYFFTRKLILVKESAAYAALPGGFGTLDEVFELLTLLQTGKAQPAPLVLVETEGTTYWHGWRSFVETQAVAAGYISEEDRSLYRVVSTVAEAMEEIDFFYSNYHSSRFVGDRLVIRLATLPSDDQLTVLNAEFADIVLSGSIRPTEPLGPEVATNDVLHLPRLSLRFNRTHYGRLRQLIDALNRCAA